MRLSKLGAWDSATKSLPKTKRNPVSEPLHLFVFSLRRTDRDGQTHRHTPTPSLPPTPTPVNFLRAGYSYDQPRPAPPSTQSSKQLCCKGIQASPDLSHMVCQPARGSHCTASALYLAAGHRQGGQAWGRDLSGLHRGPCKRKGWDEGRKATGRSEAEPPAIEAPWQGDGEREGLTGPFCCKQHSQQVRQSQITSPGFSGW